METNPVPELWEKCFREGTLAVLTTLSPVMDHSIGWMGEYDGSTGHFTYIAGYFMPAGTPVPDGLQYRDLSACTIGMGYITGGLSIDLFPRLHEMTVSGIEASGYTPDYSQGWSAEAYLEVLAAEGTVNYICPAKKHNVTE